MESGADFEEEEGFQDFPVECELTKAGKGTNPIISGNRAGSPPPSLSEVSDPLGQVPN